MTNRTADFRNLLQQAPGTAQEVSHLLNDVKPTLPVLLANPDDGRADARHHNASVEQLLVLLPPYIAAQQAYGLATNNASGAVGRVRPRVQLSRSATVHGGLPPPSQWRSPQDQTDVDTPDGLYCKLPQDSLLDVRGARNFRCIKQPGKRAPTVEICDSDKPFEPIAIRRGTHWALIRSTPMPSRGGAAGRSTGSTRAATTSSARWRGPPGRRRSGYHHPPRAGRGTGRAGRGSTPGPAAPAGGSRRCRRAPVRPRGRHWSRRRPATPRCAARGAECESRGRQGGGVRAL